MVWVGRICAHTPRRAREKERPCWGRAGWRCTSTGSSPGKPASPYGYGSPPASVLFLFRTCAGFLSCTLGRVAVHLRARLVELRFTRTLERGKCRTAALPLRGELHIGHTGTRTPHHTATWAFDWFSSGQGPPRLKSFGRKAMGIATACGIKAGHGQQRGVARMEARAHQCDPVHEIAFDAPETKVVVRGVAWTAHGQDLAVSDWYSRHIRRT